MNFMETRGMLAKLLATENLIVTHDGGCTTASFDVENRTLVLPILQTEDPHLYNMFVGHEVGHALYTPHSFDCIPDDVPFDYVNVVEDVRIEKRIQDKFPGLRVDFTKAYETLEFIDFFGIRDKDLNDLDLIDRVNLHFKIGPTAMVPFTPEERELVDLVDACETFDDVIEAARRLAEFQESQVTTNLDQLTATQTAGTGDGKMEGNESNGEANKDGEGDKGGDKKDGNNNAGGSSLQSATQRNADSKMAEMTEKARFSDNVVYANYPKHIDLDVITSVEQLRSSFSSPDEVMNPDQYHMMLEDFDKFMVDIKRDVNFMFQQFEMRKSADAYSRVQIHKTGVLNTDVLHQYKLTDDIFLRTQTTPDGKNHGMVMLVDWSGSMSGTIIQVVKQIIVLVQFCRKANIPFEVYTFTSFGGSDASRAAAVDKDISFSNAKVVQIVKSTSRRSEINHDLLNFFSSAYACQRNSSNYPHSTHLSMGGTPLNSVLFMVPAIIERFRQQTKAQKVSFVALTDGASSPFSIWNVGTYEDGSPRIQQHSPYYTNIMVRDGFNVSQFSNGRDQTSSIVKWLEQKLGDVSITNFYIGGFAACQRYLKETTGSADEMGSSATFRKDGTIAVDTKESWPLIVLANPANFGAAEEGLDCQDAASKGAIKIALKKYLKAKSSNKVVLTKLVSSFA